MVQSLASIGIIYNEQDPIASKRTAELRHADSRIVAIPSSETALPRVDLLIVLGGDGTFLRGARLVAPHGTPILGVAMGTLGFLAEVQPADLEQALMRIAQGDYQLEERVMLEVIVMRAGQIIGQAYGLNDGVVGKGVSGRMVEISVDTDDSPLATYAADGFIVATPTGSTAYALAAGGPILGPEVPAFVLVPICPHALTARSLVISNQRVVRICVHPRSAGAVVTVDGLTLPDELQAEDQVFVRKAPFCTQLVRLGPEEFFRRLRDKLQWGGRGAARDAHPATNLKQGSSQRICCDSP
ncbi:MAG: NAD(+)/NADH kinase [Cyanobacteria bacterium NC_groundwater_1444_Ag_S-0.65um_54_12]|nr:NAD(+)/NADH kinase [Cyanobacteria bacterium NC_groundwater_1444_Ag_S-0.65um_54_12]